MSKTRIDSWAANLTEEQSWTLYYKSLRCQWQEAAGWALKEFDLARMPSRTGYYEWLKQMRAKEHEHRMGEAAIAAAEAAALGQRVTKDAALVAAFKSLATDAALQTDAKTALSYVKCAMAIKDRMQKEEELDLKANAENRKDDELKLAREKFAAAEKRLNAAAKVCTESNITDEERITKIKGIFGIS